LKVFF